jgi:hypothetical protein
MPRTKAQNRRPPVPPALRPGITALVKFMTDIVDDERRAATAAVRARIGPPTLWVIIDRLIGRVRRGSYSLRRRAAESLAGLGPAAVPAVLLTLARARRRAVQVPLAEALAALAPGLSREERLKCLELLERATDGDGPATCACAVALAALRREEPADDGPSPVAGVAGAT